MITDKGYLASTVWAHPHVVLIFLTAISISQLPGQIHFVFLLTVGNDDWLAQSSQNTCYNEFQEGKKFPKATVPI